MTQPVPYNRTTDFTTVADTLILTRVNSELTSIEQTLDQICANIAVIQRDDTRIANHSVGMDQVAQDLKDYIDMFTATSFAYSQEAGEKVALIDSALSEAVTAEGMSKQYRDESQGFSVQAGNYATQAQAAVAATSQTKVTVNDSTPAYLNDKLVGGSGVSIALQDAGGDEKLLVSVVGGGSTVKVSPTDTTSDNLINKLSAGTGVTITKQNSGDNETLLVSSEVYSLPTATTTTLGGVRGGGNVDIASNGSISVSALVGTSITSPTGLVKGDVGLGNVDNTSDADKNSATATLTNKTLTSPVINTPTGIVKGDVGLGNVANGLQLLAASNLSDLANVTTAKSNLSLTKSDVGLGNVDNTSDTNKPVSTAQAAAIGLKLNTADLASSLPTATTSVFGVVKPDGTTVTVAGGVISAASAYTLPTATTTTLGGVKVDGTSITIASGVISAGGSPNLSAYAGDISLSDNLPVSTPMFSWIPRYDRVPNLMVCTRATTGAYTPQGGGIAQMPVNNIRHWHDPISMEYQGWIIEEARTNIVIQSCFVASWAVVNTVGGGIALNTTTAPDGTTTGATLAAASAAICNIYQDIVVANTTPYTFSLFVKPNTVSVVTISEGYWTGAWASFNLTGAGSVTGSGTGATNPGIQAMYGGWYRIWFTMTSGGAMYRTRIDPRAAYGGTGATGDSVYVWGAQLEQGVCPTGYIPTATASVPRNSDNILCTLGGVQARGVGNNMSFLVEFDLLQHTATNRTIFSHYNDANNYVWIGLAGTNQVSLLVMNAGSIICNYQLGVASFTSTNRVAVGLRSSALPNYGMSGSLNGAAVVTNAGGLVPSCSYQSIGSHMGTTQWLNGRFRGLYAYAVKLSDAELVALSSW